MNNISLPEQKCLTIAPGTSLDLQGCHLRVLDYLGCFSPHVHSFKVSIEKDASFPNSPPRLGLLRVGSRESRLHRELELRDLLSTYGLIAPLGAQDRFESVRLQFNTPSDGEQSTYLEEENFSEQASPSPSQTDGEQSTEDGDGSIYLEEENFLEESLADAPEEKILLLSDLPDPEYTLTGWLKTNPSRAEALSLVIQLCQCCFYFSQKGWYLINIIPDLLEFNNRLKLYDLTQVFAAEENLSSGLVGSYCAPELATAATINSLMSSYTVGALLYQSLHQKTPDFSNNLNLSIEPIPQFYQLLKIVLSPLPQERFPLEQLHQLLLSLRDTVRSTKILWQVATGSTVGLSLSRLENEDNFGIRQQQLSQTETMLLGFVADGMGGMAKGEVASKIAAQTVLGAAIPSNFQSPLQRDRWLNHLFTKTNKDIAAVVDNSGTTLSVILAVNQELMIAHVGDSRIYLLRQGKIQQLSQDHSFVALLVNNGEITPEEALQHPDRNVLLRSLGSKTDLSPGYVQNLTNINQELTLNLEPADILLLCSDGVWDLVSPETLAEVFAPSTESSLQAGVDQILEQVLASGAPDNATLVALEYSVLSR